jgi:DNA-binding NarL/FixJ family response regulator
LATDGLIEMNSNILEKLQLHSRREAALYARERGILRRVH